MSRTDPLMRVRVPVDLKGWLEQEAARNLRSMNAEIVVSIRDRMEKAKSASEGVAPPPKASPEA